MKKIYFFIISLLLTSSGLAISPPLLPFPFGQEIIIDGKPASNLMIKIEDKNYDVIKTNTNEEGQFLVDLVNVGKYSIGDSFKVTVYKGDENRQYEVTIEEEGGLFFSKSIKWDENTFTDSEKEPDLSTVMKYLKEQEQKNYEQSLKDRNTSWIIAIISLVVSFLFFIWSWKITKYYAEKHSCKYTHKVIKNK